MTNRKDIERCTLKEKDIGVAGRGPLFSVCLFYLKVGSGVIAVRPCGPAAMHGRSLGLLGMYEDTVFMS